MTAKVRIKITLDVSTKDALETVASRLGMPLAVLIAETASASILGTTEGTLGSLDRRLSRLEQTLASQPKVEPQRTPTKAEPKPDIVSLQNAPKSARVVRKGAAVLMTKADSPLPDLSVYRTIGLYDLVARFTSNGISETGLVARLCQLGGRKGDLFRGSLGHAQTVAKLTASLDPQGLSWLPTDAARRQWIQITAEDYARAILR